MHFLMGLRDFFGLRGSLLFVGGIMGGCCFLILVDLLT